MRPGHSKSSSRVPARCCKLGGGLNDGLPTQFSVHKGDSLLPRCISALSLRHTVIQRPKPPDFDRKNCHPLLRRRSFTTTFPPSPPPKAGSLTPGDIMHPVSYHCTMTCTHLPCDAISVPVPCVSCRMPQEWAGERSQDTVTPSVSPVHSCGRLVAYGIHHQLLLHSGRRFGRIAKSPDQQSGHVNREDISHPATGGVHPRAALSKHGHPV